MIGRLGNITSYLGNIVPGHLLSGVIFTESVSTEILISHNLLKSKHKSFNILSEIELDQDIEETNTKGTHNTLNLVSEVTYTRGYIIRVSNQLVLNQSLSRQITYFRDPSNTIVFKKSKILGELSGQVIERPEVIVTKVKRYVTFVTPNQNLILPAPLFGDKENVIGELKLLKTIGGTLYAYGKRNLNRKLTYSFELSRIKGLELRSFVENYRHLAIFMENWKGEVWYVNFINNPITFSTVARASKTRELVKVDLELEGLRIL